MGEAYFYHMTRTPLEETLPALLGRAREQDWRVVVRGRNEARLRWLDERLWLGDGFLPHGLSGGPHDADQPILLTAGGEAAECVVSMDGAEVAPEEVTTAARVMILFDGNDDGAVERAREQWRQMSGAGVGAKYWSQETGRWALKAESAGRAAATPE
ncbi:DNA polymerase III subunit chi [Maritimibacter sp. UBA3975]|uniref:DNA polymerase III subunit chi n=1 Tax=Maritimibacter sp. UBA3975 TaxID=1946833 RepID=UPI000C0AB0B3|nr:DNA polymerase III subunit chi [Maritimibacter sp. UBA3975]MAM60176.1 DNA polymerase III subunit chi [Maritimibacter sp.]|tara:strand:+ start:3699 stop:4169 length:471 start_codon:yes stop_codon:yes gene_type:complete